MKKKIDMQKVLAPAALVILYVFFSFTGRNFFGYEGLKQILQSCYYIGYMAFGITFVIITGGIDLSLGTNMMCSALLGGVAYSVWGWPLVPSLVFVLLVGVFFGLCNGVMIAKLKLPPFIATLGTQMITMGFGSIISGVRTMYYPTVGSPDEWFRSVFYIHGKFPTGAVWLIGAFCVAWFLLNKTRFGRNVYAIGSNEEATRLSGVQVDKWKIAVYVVCGLFTAMAGIFYGAAYTTIIPGKGNGEEMNGIAAVVIGGTSMAGGSGTMLGTLLGVLIMATLKKGLASVGLQAHWQTFFTGFVVIGAVLLDNLRNSAAQKAAKKG
ncbi:MAG: ABC transporter permease [Clostridiales bacterium]|nr:ABC transporter permease [Clostridiales bacterium]